MKFLRGARTTTALGTLRRTAARRENLDLPEGKFDLLVLVLAFQAWHTHHIDLLDVGLDEDGDNGSGGERTFGRAPEDEAPTQA